MKIAKKIMYFVLTVAMIILVFTGCGTSKTEKSQNEQSNQSETSNSSKEQSKEKVKLTYYCYVFRDEDFDTIKKQFNQKYSNVELELKPQIMGSSQERQDKLTVMLVGGEDINLFDSNQTEYFKYSNMNLYEPLDEYVTKDNYDLNQFGEDVVKMSRINGKLYAMPFISSMWLMYYNKDLFDEAGVAYPTDDWTWDDFREAAKKLTKGEGSDKIWGFTMPNWSVAWAGIASQAGAVYTKEDGTPALNDSRFKDALQFKYDLTMVDKTGPSFAENTLTKVHYAKQFSSGKVAMLPAGNWVFSTVKDNLGGNYTFEYDVVAMPHPEGAEPGTTWGANRYFGINAKCCSKEQKKAAWEFLKYCTSDEGAKIIINKGGFPANTSSPKVREMILKEIPDFVTNANVQFKEHRHVAEQPFHVNAGQIERIMKEESELALTGAKKIDDAIEDMQKRAVKEIEKSNK